MGQEETFQGRIFLEKKDKTVRSGADTGENRVHLSRSGWIREN